MPQICIISGRSLLILGGEIEKQYSIVTQTNKEVMAILPLLLCANSVMKMACPEIYNEMVQTDRDFRLAGTCFTMGAVNSSDCTLHRDYGKGLDILMYGGDFIGGELCVPQLGIKVLLQKGDLVILDSRLFHEVLRFYHSRYSIVFFAKPHHKISKKKNTLEVPEDLKWLSKENFSLF